MIVLSRIFRITETHKDPAINPPFPFLGKIRDSFTRESSHAGLFFFFVLASWYVLRPVRNEIAVENEANISILLGVGALVMLLANPLYARIASRANLARLLTFCYGFFIVNLLIFIVLWRVLAFESMDWLARSFYIWCNVYSFFVVSIFWVVIINLFRGKTSRGFYGVIAAGGSLGAYLGAELSKRLAPSFVDQGIDLFAFGAIAFLVLALAVGLSLIGNHRDRVAVGGITGGTGMDAIRNLLTRKEIGSIGMYVFLYTGLMTVLWVSSLAIINQLLPDTADRIRLFGDIDQITTVLTFLAQLFLTASFIDWFGIRKILISYGIIFALVFVLYALAPGIGVVVFSTVFLRLFEYAFNKPTREIVLSQLPRIDRYKSSVLINTFVLRLGDFSGSGFVFLVKSFGAGSSSIPLLALPLTAVLWMVGVKVSKDQ
uniref:ATP:ADP antiporter, AAA family n=1 Tax=Candidatus Kentrum sp. FW TaxID=2126338 RepID=A0A450SK98_9GAMM|nr:MAG: ATP:ADP antiporter, AAA family [Candidatus Kentron sp. FW]